MKRLLLTGLALLTLSCSQYVNEQQHGKQTHQANPMHKKHARKNSIAPEFHAEQNIDNDAIALFMAGCTHGAYWHVKEWYKREMGMDASPDVIHSEVEEMWNNRNQYGSGKLWNKFGGSKDEIFGGCLYRFYPDIQIKQQ
jgi:hypothetical protein